MPTESIGEADERAEARRRWASLAAALALHLAALAALELFSGEKLSIAFQPPLSQAIELLPTLAAPAPIAHAKAKPVPLFKKSVPEVKPIELAAPQAAGVPMAGAETHPSIAPAAGVVAPPATHGPIVAYGPSPRLPSYLRDQNLKASVAIDFAIGADGSASPHLALSSGYDELDAIALDAAHLWRFEPAEQDHAPVASHVRLRLNFVVQ